MAGPQVGLDVAGLIESLVAQGTFVGLGSGVDELVSLQVEPRREVLVTMLTLQESPNATAAFPSIPSTTNTFPTTGIGRHVVTARAGGHTRPLQVTTKVNQRSCYHQVFQQKHNTITFETKITINNDSL